MRKEKERKKGTFAFFAILENAIYTVEERKLEEEEEKNSSYSSRGESSAFTFTDGENKNGTTLEGGAREVGGC